MKFDNIKNIIFDFDGVLIDSSQAVVEATNYALEKLGDPARQPGEIRRFIGYPLEEMFYAFSQNSYEKFWEFFREKAREVVADGTCALDDADEILHKLSERGYNLGLGTTKISQHIKLILEKFDWTNLLKITVGADQVSKVKPDPEVFNKVRKLMNGELNNTVVVGDTINDIYAARAASLPVIGVKSPFGGDDKMVESNPDFIITHLKELLVIFADQVS